MSERVRSYIQSTHIAYFTCEIALRQEMHTYAGGLGVLAGDTARTCADLGIPVVFVSLASRSGYLHQEIDEHGAQTDHPDPWDPAKYCIPLNAMVAIELDGRPVWIRPWLYRHSSGNDQTPVILLDTDCEENAAPDRDITARLYGGDQVNRLKQQSVLGIGGVRMLHALGFDIRTYHMNEGHSALLTAELLRRHPIPPAHQMPGGMLYDFERVTEQCIFTTHTPIEATQDRHPYELINRVLGDLIEIDELRRYAGHDACNMTRLALNLSGYLNGVAQRHAETTRHLFPGYNVRTITNGVHLGFWTHRAFANLYDRYLPRWVTEPEVLSKADQLDDAKIWDAHGQAKSDLIRLVHERTGVQFRSDVPLIGFARRMTGYKRPELLLSDFARLCAINGKQPFQVLWAGKAHPADVEGKRLIAEINQQIAVSRGEFPMAFLSNYDLDTGKAVVSGCDVWLNTPQPPLEASGTSGMKAAVNGLLNLSVLDGWWVEAWIEGTTGWAIGHDGGSENDGDYASDLYGKLETAVLPLYYGDRAKWIWMMKQSISKIAPYFNSHRMMRRYASEAYLR